MDGSDIFLILFVVISFVLVFWVSIREIKRQGKEIIRLERKRDSYDEFLKEKTSLQEGQSSKNLSIDIDKESSRASLEGETSNKSSSYKSEVSK